MASLESIRQTKVASTLQNNNLNFGSLLRTIRLVLGIKMSTVCEDTGIDSQKLRGFEMERFRREPQSDDIKILANYYGISHEHLQEKLELSLKTMQEMRQNKIAQ